MLPGAPCQRGLPLIFVAPQPAIDFAGGRYSGGVVKEGVAGSAARSVV